MANRVIYGLPRLKPLIDCNLPEIYEDSITSWGNKFSHLYSQVDDDTDALGPHITFALTGHYDDPPADGSEEPVRRRFKIQTSGGRTVPNPLMLVQHSDVDSAIGFIHRGQAFPLKETHALLYQILDDPGFTLVASLHIPPYKLPSEHPEDPSVFIHYHKMPNALFALIGGAKVQKILVRIFFPRLAAIREPHEGNTVDVERQTLFYNLAVRRVVMDVLPASSHPDWPAVWNSEQWRAHKRSGHFVHTIKVINAEVADEFIEDLHIEVAKHAELEWAVGFILQIQVQGTKHGAPHNLPERPITDNLSDEDAAAALHDYQEEVTDQRIIAAQSAVDPLSLLAFDWDNWYFDIATTFSYVLPTGSPRSSSLFIRHEMHDHLISHFTGLSISTTRALMNRPSLYASDQLAHFSSLAGFRFTVPPAHYDTQIFYVQGYTTDKTLSSLKDGPYVSKHINPSEVLDDYKASKVNFFDPLEQAFSEATKAEVQVHARFETRVSGSMMEYVHHHIPPLVAYNWLCRLQTKAFWRFKRFRAFSLSRAIGLACQQLRTAHEDMMLSTGTLVAGGCFMTNALGNRPEQRGPEFDILAHTLSVHKEDGDALIPVQPLDTFHIHSLRLHPVLHVSSHRCLGEETLAKLCGLWGTNSKTQLIKLLRGGKNHTVHVNNSLPVWGPGRVQLDGLPPRAVNRSHTVRLQIDDTATVVIPEDAPDIPEPPRATAGQRAESVELDFEEPLALQGTRTQLNQIFNRMGGEMMMKVSSNTAPSFSWRIIPEAACHDLTFANTLCDSTRLPHLLVGWYQMNQQPNWDKAVARLFPTLTEKAALDKWQNFNTLSFWNDWGALLERLDPMGRELMVAATRKIANRKIQWLPVGQARLWGGKPFKVPRYYFGRDGASPVGIALNPAFVVDLKEPGGRQSDIPIGRDLQPRYVAH